MSEGEQEQQKEISPEELIKVKELFQTFGELSFCICCMTYIKA
jgi:hypothetical protein